MFSDWTYYNNTYKGSLSEAEYNQTAPIAYQEIISETSGQAMSYTLPDNAPESVGEAVSDNLKMCECELCDFMFDYAQIPFGTTSVNNDGYAVSNIGTAMTAAKSEAITGICERWLQTPYNLMCRWL